MSTDPNHDPASPLGWDIDVDTDMQPDGRACSGARLVGNAILHRLMEDTLLKTGAPNGVIPYGKDARKLIGSTLTQPRADALGPAFAAVINRDPRIDPAQTRVVATVGPSLRFPSGEAVDLALSITAQTTTGLPIALVVGVSSLTVALLSQPQGS